MPKPRYPRGAVRCWLVVTVAALVVLAFASSASAHTGLFELFNTCPTGNPEVDKCVNSTVYGGEVVLGKKTTPLVNPVTFEAGYTLTDRALGLGPDRVSTVIAATDGVTLSKTPEPVPGGLLGLVPPASSPPAIKQLSAYYSQHQLTGVNAVVEIAGPSSDVRLSEFNLLSEEELALYFPIKIHLENPFLGGSCYVGSNSSPIVLELTTGSTEGFWSRGLHGAENKVVPLPNKPIRGTAGDASIIGEEQIGAATEAVLVDNRWSAPGATGCGGVLAPLVDPLIDAAAGLPSPAGRNTLIMKVNFFLARKASVNSH